MPSLPFTVPGHNYISSDSLPHLTPPFTVSDSVHTDCDFRNLTSDILSYCHSACPLSDPLQLVGVSSAQLGRAAGIRENQSVHMAYSCGPFD